MAWNPNAWFTWQGKETPTPTLWECHESAIANAVEAAEKEARLARQRDSLPQGDDRLTGGKNGMPIEHRIRQARIEQAHWRAAARDFETRARAEAAAAPAVRPPPSAFTPPEPAPGPADNRLPAENDPDDISTFAAEDPSLVRDIADDELEPGEQWGAEFQ